MYNKIKNLQKYKIGYFPRLVILLIDIVLVAVSLLASYNIINYENDSIKVFYNPLYAGGLIILVNLTFMYLFKTYAGVIRYSTFVDINRVLFSVVCSVFFIKGFNILIYNILDIELIDRINVFLLVLGVQIFFFQVLFRILVKIAFKSIKNLGYKESKKNILVFGIDELSVALAAYIIDNPHIPYYVDGFITEEQEFNSKNSCILGKRVVCVDKKNFPPKKKLDVEGVIIIKELFSKNELNQWVNIFLNNDLQVFSSSVIERYKVKINKINIEDLMERERVEVENIEVGNQVKDKVILVTGGAGSIGSKIVEKVALYNPSVLVVLDQAETPLYDIELEMRKKFPKLKLEFVIGDITNYDRLKFLFEKYRFSIVYHAAAYKHVPLVELNPNEGVLVNVLGTKNLALLSSEFKVETFVMVSTDKAVNPTNVMGATKRTAELYVQSLQKKEGNQTKYITTRFGNVLGSSGSVIPYFMKQIENGGSITITHPEIVRYFMSISEACELVLMAGAIGCGGEIFVFDMGEPIKIVDLAKKMIKLYGLEEDNDIKIVYTGLRPGEKLYEELLSDNTKNIPTPYKKIMISKDPPMAIEEINTLVSELVEEAKGNDRMEVVRKLKKVVKNFKSNNSIYECLD